jgi:hypothetical protein
MMAPSTPISTSGGGNPFGRNPDSTSNPEILTPPAPEPSYVPDPDARSQLNGAECPWGADQFHQARQIEQAGFKIEYNCDLVLYQEDLYGSITPNWPTFDEVKKNFYDTVAALAAQTDFLKMASEKHHFSRITFGIKKDGTEISFAQKTLFFTAYGTGDPNKALDYLKAVFEFEDTHLDGLPVVSSLGKIRITGSPAQLEYTLSTLQTFTETYANYRNEFLNARDAFQEIEIGERPEDDAPLFRNGTLTMPMKTDKPWAVHDALQVARSYLKLPEGFRNAVTIDFDLPDPRAPEQARIEQTAAKAVELLAKKVAYLQLYSPGLQRVTLSTCNALGDGNASGCGAVNPSRTVLDLGFFIREPLNDASVTREILVDDQLARLLPH